MPVPAVTSSSSAASPTVRASGPSTVRPWNSSPPVGMRPRWGLMPTRPVHAAGMRTEPAPSEPSAPATMPAATAAADPPEEPPGVWPGSHGLRVAPNAAPSVNGHWPSSGVFVLPTITAPACLSRATAGASAMATGKSPGQPNAVGWPARSTSSLIATGTPSSGARSPFARRRSASAASASASSSRIRRNALSTGWLAFAWSSAVAVSWADVTEPAASAVDCAARPAKAVVSGLTVISGSRLSFVRTNVTTPT